MNIDCALCVTFLSPLLQVVHHLFPNVCHTHYPAIAPIVLQTCAEFGIPYTVFPTVRRPAPQLACAGLLERHQRVCLSSQASDPGIPLCALA